MITAEDFEAENPVVDNLPVEYLTKWEFAEAYAEHYAKEVVNSITDKEIDGTFSIYHYYANKGAKWFKQQLLKRIEDGK